MKVNRIFFPEIQNFLIPSFLRSANKETKGQNQSIPTFMGESLKISKPSFVSQSLEIVRGHKENEVILASPVSEKGKNPFPADSIAKWFRSLDPKNPEDNKPVWNYLFPDFPWSKDQFLFLDENQKFQSMAHITPKGVYLSLIFSSDYWGEMGFVLRSDQMPDETLSILGCFSDETSEELFHGEFRSHKETKDWKFETKVSKISPPNGNYR